MDQRSYCVKCHQPIAFCLMWGGHESKKGGRHGKDNHLSTL